MERSQQNTDCYFFYYSTCSKGDNCAFRHEPSALGCETVCSYWQQGNCLNEHCNFRHMELKKNRKAIPCYWEGQPSGCMKPHCPFFHTHPRTIINNAANPVKTSDLPSKPANQEWSNHQEDTKFDGSGTESDQGRGSSEAGSFIGSPAVDPVIVNFEEESDNESMPSPVKKSVAKMPGCKTYEEIRLEEIQAESAAYYSYETSYDANSLYGIRAQSVFLRQESKENAGKVSTNGGTGGDLNFGILTLEEIRKRKELKNATATKIEDEDKKEEEKKPEVKKKLVNLRRNKVSNDFLKDAVKSLVELKQIKTLEMVTSSKEEAVCPKEKVTCSKEEVIYPKEIICPKEVVTSSKNEVIVEPVMSKVPPVRLRRTTNVARLVEAERTKIPEQEDQTQHAAKRLAVDCMADETGHVIKRSKIECFDGSSSNRKVEVRLCDSSTDEEKRSNQKHPSSACDSILSMEEDEEYLVLETCSEDILKDIDAILTDKAAVANT